MQDSGTLTNLALVVLLGVLLLEDVHNEVHLTACSESCRSSLAAVDEMCQSRGWRATWTSFRVDTWPKFRRPSH